VPKLISEVTSGQSNELSVQQGQASGSRTRSWRVVLSAPGEQYSVEGAIGVRVGDLYPGDLSMTCASISERASGDSRTVREITATYRTIDGHGQQPEPPDIRPATFSISSSLMEMPAKKWRLLAIPGLAAESDTINPCGDRYEGITKTVPIITITLEQFDNAPMTNLHLSGHVNEDKFEFLGWSIEKYHCMLRSINVRPVVEKFGDLTYRGFTRAYEFAVKPEAGWIHEQIVEGWNCFNNGLNVGGNDAVDEGALSLKHNLGVVVTPLALATPAGKKVRASVKIASVNAKDADSWCQRPSGLPVALNVNGTPRDVNVADPKVLTEEYVVNPVMTFGRNFQNLGVRVRDIL
jgi:hypothetical protein